MPIPYTRDEDDMPDITTPPVVPAPPVSTKVVSSAASGAAATLIIWLLTALGVDVPAAVAAAITVLVGVVAGYLTKDASKYLQLALDHREGKHVA